VDEHGPLQARTPTTSVTAAALAGELAITRRRGCAIGVDALRVELRAAINDLDFGAAASDDHPHKENE
jgi:DNA-binding IclR family transcriptional regulator